MNTYSKPECQNIMHIFGMLHDELLIVKKILYKIKNQMGNQKQYQYLQQIKKIIYKDIIQCFHHRKNNLTIEVNKINTKLRKNNKEEFDYLYDIIDKCGLYLLGMLRLKLHCGYSTIILSILSRVRVLLSSLYLIYKL